MGILRTTCLLAGLAALGLTAALDGIARSLFAGHMARHLVLMDAAAPLLLLAVPGERLAGAVARLGRLAAPAVAAVLHGLVMWGWHAPAALTATMDSAPLRAAMLASFASAGLLFWATVLASGRRDGLGFGSGLFWTFMTLMHVGLLAALLTFAPAPLYPLCGSAARYGLTPLEDQQLAGLILWVPAGGVYLAAGLWLAAAWLRDIERRTGWAEGGR